MVQTWLSVYSYLLICYWFEERERERGREGGEGGRYERQQQSNTIVFVFYMTG